MDLIQSIALGVIEGISEFLPISSTGHLILAANLLGIPQTEFVKTFEIAIQSGAIFAVIFLYRKKLLSDFELLKRIAIGFIPTAVIGYILYNVIKQYLIGNSEVVLISLFVGGVVLILVELFFKNRTNHKSSIINNKSDLTYEKSFVIGLFQSLAVVPGVSRSASSIIGAMLIGIDRKTATEFSFLLAIPTMFAATALDLKETGFNINSNQWMALGIRFIVSFFVAMAAIKWLVKYVQTNTFIPFGIYRIVLSLFYFLLILK